VVAPPVETFAPRSFGLLPSFCGTRYGRRHLHVLRSTRQLPEGNPLLRKSMPAKQLVANVQGFAQSGLWCRWALRCGTPCISGRA
jgi:hypothetical protein